VNTKDNELSPEVKEFLDSLTRDQRRVVTEILRAATMGAMIDLARSTVFSDVVKENV